jgi:hypothetical protein
MAGAIDTLYGECFLGLERLNGRLRVLELPCSSTDKLAAELDAKFLSLSKRVLGMVQDVVAGVTEQVEALLETVLQPVHRALESLVAASAVHAPCVKSRSRQRKPHDPLLPYVGIRTQSCFSHLCLLREVRWEPLSAATFLSVSDSFLSGALGSFGSERVA